MKEIVLVALAASVWLGACDSQTNRDRPAGERASRADDDAATPAVTVTEYTTELQFLPLEPASTRALILQFTNVAASDGLNHRYTGWLLNRSGWSSILDTNVHDPPTGAPWRLFPTESLRLTVSADGEPDDLIIRVGRADYTLDLGGRLDGWEDRAGTRHEIRMAQFVRGAQRVPGVVVQHRFAIPEPQRPARFGPYERVILRSEDGAIIVLFHTQDPDTYGDSFAWMYADGLSRRWTALEARTVEVANSPQLRRNIPVRTWFHIPEPDIKVELTARDKHFSELPVEQGPKPYNALYRVRGWIEFSGERRNVRGVLERGEP